MKTRWSPYSKMRILPYYVIFNQHVHIHGCVWSTCVIPSGAILSADIYSPICSCLLCYPPPIHVRVFLTLMTCAPPLSVSTRMPAALIMANVVSEDNNVISDNVCLVVCILAVPPTFTESAQGQCLYFLRSGVVPCPVFENDKIVQQPADFLGLTSSYVDAATSFIKANAGMYA